MDNNISSFAKYIQLVQKMTDSGYGEAIRSRISDTETFDPSYYDSELFGVSGSGSMGTTHISVLGPNGDAVSITSTVNLLYVVYV
jgi:gamma-glutamyltranspeptidase/glutathione hydrolase/leukotriene-C4 hydrolase